MVPRYMKMDSLRFRHSLAGNHFHHFTEPVKLPKRRIDIGRDPNPGKFFVNDRRREYFVLRHQIAADCDGIDAFDLEHWRSRMTALGSNEVLKPTFGMSFSLFIQ